MNESFIYTGSVPRTRPEERQERLDELIDAAARVFTRHGYRRLDRYLERDPTNWYFAPKPSHIEAFRSSLSDLRCRLAACDAAPGTESNGGAG